MLAQMDSIILPTPRGMQFITWRSITVPRWPERASWCYLIHFDRRIGNLENRRATAQHYIGFTCDLQGRLADHRAGNGAAIMRAVSEQGIPWHLARLWKCGTPKEGYLLEKRLKARKDAPALCPICQQKPLDGYTMLARRMWPFHLFHKPARMKAHPQRFLTFGRAFSSHDRLL